MSEAEMRIALPTNDRIHIEEHFGHAREFAFALIKEGNIVSTEFLSSPPHERGVIPGFVSENGATAVITGGMGNRAARMFADRKIEVILGAKGRIDQNLKTYLSGDLTSSGSTCEHDHHDKEECNNAGK